MRQPSMLCRYRRIDSRLRQVLVDSKLYFASPRSLIDPFECRFVISDYASETQKRSWAAEMLAHPLVRKKLMDSATAKGPPGFLTWLQAQSDDELARVLADTPDLAKLVQETAEQLIDLRVGVCCFCEISDDPVLFAHYGANHEGCCLEFSTTDPLLAQAFKVTYADTPPSLGFFALTLRQLAEAMLGTKRTRWAYELEWRVISAAGPGLRAFRPDCLTGIVLGHRCSTESEAAVRAWVAERASPIPLFKLSLERDGYSFRRTRLA